jgi:hypothetical protein
VIRKKDLLKRIEKLEDRSHTHTRAAKQAAATLVDEYTLPAPETLWSVDRKGASLEWSVFERSYRWDGAPRHVYPPIKRTVDTTLKSGTVPTVRDAEIAINGVLWKLFVDSKKITVDVKLEGGAA